MSCLDFLYLARCTIPHALAIQTVKMGETSSGSSEIYRHDLISKSGYYDIPQRTDRQRTSEAGGRDASKSDPQARIPTTDFPPNVGVSIVTQPPDLR